MKEVKKKQNDIRKSTTQPKTAEAQFSAQSNPTVSVKPTDSMQRSYVSEKIKTKDSVMEQPQIMQSDTKQSQSEQPTNYAVNKVERAERQAAYGTANATGKAVNYTKNKVMQQKAERIEYVPQPEPVSTVHNPPSVNNALPAHSLNQEHTAGIKTKDAVTESSKPDNGLRSKAAIKTKDAVKQQSAVQTDKPKTAIKTKEAIRKKSASKAQNISVSEPMPIKTKEAIKVRAEAQRSAAKQEPVTIKSKDSLRQQAVMKAKAQKSEQNISTNTPKTREAVEMKSAQVQPRTMPIKSKEAIKAQAAQKSAVKAEVKNTVVNTTTVAMPIKTKEAVLQSEAKSDIVGTLKQPMMIKTKEALQKQAEIKAKEQKSAQQSFSSDAPKTREVYESRSSVKYTDNQSAVKAKQQAVSKVKSQSAAKSETMKIKTRDEYIKSYSDITHIAPKSGNHIKPKTIEYVKSRADAAKPITDKEQFARNMSAKTAKNKFELKKLAAQQEMFAGAAAYSATEASAMSEAATAAVMSVPATVDAPTQAVTEIVSGIKTKEAYINSKVKGRKNISVINTDNTSLKQKNVSRIKAASQRLTKLRNNKVKSVQTANQAAKKTAKQAAKRARHIKRTAAATGKTVKNTAKITAKAAAVVTRAVSAIISALVAGGSAGVLVAILIVICIIASIAASPFGIYISGEVSEAGTIPLSQIIAEYNVELTQAVEDTELAVAHDEIEVVDEKADTSLIIAIFAVKTAGTDDNTAQDVVVFDNAKAEQLKAYLRNANTISYTTEATVYSEDDIEVKMTITVTGKTKDELISEYGLTDRQKEALETLLQHGDVIATASQSLAITDANVQSIVSGLPASLPQKRKDVVKNAASLVGKVNYFWGGKSSAIGWDSAWGSMQRVTAAGSPSSGSIRSYGLDCSGYVSWAFNNSGMYVGDGTYGQRGRSTQITASNVQAGDLCFLPSYSHVGIVVGRDASGNILVFHCSSSANNVVLSTASSVGFTVFRRPNCY